MKKFLPFFILAMLQLSIKTVIAQEFAPIGATWYYTQNTMSPELYYVKKECIGDTLINNKICRIIKGGEAGCSNDNIYEYLYSDSNKVFRYDIISNQFNLLYNFNANTGDSWVISHRFLGYESFITIRVDSISDTLINNQLLKILNISLLDSNGNNNYSFGFEGKIIERIGSDFYMFPQVLFCDPVTGGLRCYNDSIINYNINIYPSCDYIYTGIQNINNNEKIEMFPNPFVDILNIKNINASNYLIKILNTSLQTVFISKENSKNISINLSFLVKGIYLCFLSNEQGYFKLFKIVKL